MHPLNQHLHLISPLPRLCNNYFHHFLIVPIRNWKFSDSNRINNPYFHLINQSLIVIDQNGLYIIEVQLGWRKRGEIANFEIVNTEKTLTQCVSYFPEAYATLQTCFSSVTQHLIKGDSLYIVINFDTIGISVDFDNTKSFVNVHFVAEDS